MAKTAYTESGVAIKNDGKIAAHEDCCCEATVDYDCCQDGSNIGPRFLKITFYNIDNCGGDNCDSGEDCCCETNFNGESFICEFYQWDAGSSKCNYAFNGTSCGAGSDYPEIWLGLYYLGAPTNACFLGITAKSDTIGGAAGGWCFYKMHQFAKEDGSCCEPFTITNIPNGSTCGAFTNCCKGNNGAADVEVY